MSTVTPAKKYIVTVHVAGPQRRSDGKRSQAGHMWYSLSDGTGEVKSYGFCPKNQGTHSGLGNPRPKTTPFTRINIPEKFPSLRRSTKP